MKQIRNKNKGFTLIEMIVSTSILVMIIGGIVLFGVRSVEAHARSQAMQIAVENARYAMESMNKKIRTSHDVNLNDASNSTTGLSQVYFVDNVDSIRYCLYFDSNALMLAKSSSDSLNSCSEVKAGGTISELVGGSVSVSGKFYVIESDAAARGIVTTAIKLEQNSLGANPTEKDTVTIQSSVSLRDYYY